MRIPFTTLVRTLAALVCLVVTTVSADGQVVQEYATGLRSPAKLLALSDGSLLVAEAGNGPNTGRISIVDRDRRRFTVVDGLPSALFLGRDPSGPSGLLLIGDRLYVSIGGGDTTVAGAGQGSEIPHPSPASPLFSSVLLLEFPSDARDIPLGFTLPFGAHDATQLCRGTQGLRAVHGGYRGRQRATHRAVASLHHPLSTAARRTTTG